MRCAIRREICFYCSIIKTRNRLVSNEQYEKLIQSLPPNRYAFKKTYTFKNVINEMVVHWLYFLYKSLFGYTVLVNGFEGLEIG